MGVNMSERFTLRRSLYEFIGIKDEETGRFYRFRTDYQVQDLCRLLNFLYAKSSAQDIVFNYYQDISNENLKMAEILHEYNKRLVSLEQEIKQLKNGDPTNED